MIRCAPTTLSILCGLLLLSACSDEMSVTAPGVPSSRKLATATADDQRDPVEPVVQALAHALSDPKLRARMLADLRDSPFPQHKLHLKSYLEGARGRAFIEAGAEAAQMTAPALYALLESLPELEILVPNELDRLRWTGTADIVVAGTTRTGADLVRGGPLAGYRTSGDSETVHIFGRASFPVLLIFPARTDFGPKPEDKRQAAPKRKRNTISTPKDEFSVKSEDCDPNTAVMECDTSGGGSGEMTGGQAIPSGYTSQCFVPAGSAGDADHDEVLELCEYEIAYAFRPYLSVSTTDDDLRREEYWAVKRNSTYSVLIFYAFSYYNDGGSPVDDSYKHAGDSEWIFMEVEYANGKWGLLKAKLSAHWGEITNSTETHSYDGFYYPDGVTRTRPLIWVAEDKHANYNSEGSCDVGAGLTDNCDRNTWALDNIYYAFNVFSDANLGYWGYTFKNDVYSRGSSIGGGSQGVDPDRREWYWMTAYKFRGWQTSDVEGSAGSYGEILYAHDF